MGVCICKELSEGDFGDTTPLPDRKTGTFGVFVYMRAVQYIPGI